MHEAREECGVFAIYAPGEDVARTTFFGLYALQHRGQESAGITTGDGTKLETHAEMGLVSQVFDEEKLSHLQGHLAIGHTRYSTTGSSRSSNAQPIVIDSQNGRIAIAHNGNLVNTAELKADLEEQGHTYVTTTDSEVIGRIIAETPGKDWVERIERAMHRLVGAYSLVLATPTEIYVVRDPMGVRPLCLGQLGSGWVAASETCALDTISAKFLREVQPGEILRIDQNGPVSREVKINQREALCIFEYIYFARPDSVIGGRRLYMTRERMGAQLAKEHPVDADVVIGVPDSATAAAVGYARESGIPYREGIVKSRYIGRTFIQPDQRLREAGIRLKFNPLPEVLLDKRVVVVDDSIVRGTTTRPLVLMLRQAGAREVHVRISSPPWRYPCVLGIDTPMARRHELIAARLSIEEIRQHIDADSLGFLSLDGLVESIQLPGNKFCNACLTGDYPVPVQLELDKFPLELRV
ncbi:MAG: amidophosphoribosyltransferase [Chloroflexi bacterium]|nr:amidophosphoribosyltransferase [Chloroflexota bacterium]